MNNNFIPIIRIEVDNLKAGIMQALGVRGSELGGFIQERIDQELRNYLMDLGGIIDTLVKEAFREQLKTYFSQGEGAETIQKAISDLFGKGREQQ